MIEPTGARDFGFAELWEYRELLFFLAWRDVKVRYKQTVLGIAWAIVQPLGAMVVFSIFFGRLAGLPSDGLPYPVFALAALVPWTFFAGALGSTTNSLVASAHLLSKVYFPRLIIPCSSVLSALVDLVITFILLLIVALWFGVPPSAKVLWLPIFTLLAVGTALGAGLWLSALNVQFRDVRYVLPFLTQMWLFASPVTYPTNLVPERWRMMYALNPMVGVVDGFRWSLLDTPTSPGVEVLVSVAVVVLMLTSGARYFRRMERTFADLV